MTDKIWDSRWSQYLNFILLDCDANVMMETNFQDYEATQQRRPESRTTASPWEIRTKYFSFKWEQLPLILRVWLKQFTETLRDILLLPFVRIRSSTKTDIEWSELQQSRIPFVVQLDGVSEMVSDVIMVLFHFVTLGVLYWSVHSGSHLKLSFPIILSPSPIATRNISLNVATEWLARVLWILEVLLSILGPITYLCR